MLLDDKSKTKIDKHNKRMTDLGKKKTKHTHSHKSCEKDYQCEQSDVHDSCVRFLGFSINDGNTKFH